MLPLYLALCVAPAIVLGGLTSDPTTVAGQTFDYIIVGGGLAGLTVAARLTENSNIKVLVIEAGNDSRNDKRVYDFYEYPAASGTELDWAYATDFGVIRAGKTLGGGTAINGALWTRGAKAQYDAWNTLLDPADQSLGWGWNGIFSYMKKSEGFSGPNSNQKALGAGSVSSYHGTTGPVQVTFPEKMFTGPDLPAFVKVMNSTSFALAKSPDLNGGNPNCVTYVPYSINWHKGDNRSSSAEAYYTPNQSRPNWTILIKSQVTKIIFSSSTSVPRVATGVQFGSSTNLYTANAAREVIVAAGAIGSPALLQLSGIGDASKLSALGISSIVDLKTVGLNLQEQTVTPMGAKGNGFSEGGNGPADIIAYPNIYQLFGSGAANMVKHIQNSISTWASSQANSALSSAALQTIFNVQAGLIINNKAPVAEMHYDSGYPDAIGVIMWQLLPFSRGNVAITSSNPFTRPTVNVRPFSVDFDLYAQIGVSRFVRRAFQTSPLKSYSKGETSPGFSVVPDDTNHGSNSSWTSWIKSKAHPVSHPIGTCSMMSRSLGGVVDGHLRVYDTSNVRVVDGSILPLQVSAHLSSSIYGVAEKAADLIKADQ